MPRPRKTAGDASIESSILKLRADLLHVDPAIWRQIEIPGSHTLTGLHRVLQQLMGWHEGHLWAFRMADRHFEKSGPWAGQVDDAAEDPDKTVLSALFQSTEDSILYHYDFGDDWMILVSFEAQVAPEPGVRYPRCLAGERAGPPEDCGGPPGFEELLAARRNPRKRGAKDLLKWVGTEWNPDSFDLAAINKSLASVRTPVRLH